MNRCCVQKFGGTSVADAAAMGRLVAIVRREVDISGTPPVVVVSAMSGVTDRLLAMAAAAVRGERAEVMRELDELRIRHESAAAELLSDASRGPVIAALGAQVDDLRAVLTAVAILQEASPRSLDGLAAAGELMSSRIVAAALSEAGVASVWVDPRLVVITNAAHTCATPAPEAIRAAVAHRITPYLDEGRAVVFPAGRGAHQHRQEGRPDRPFHHGRPPRTPPREGCKG